MGKMVIRALTSVEKEKNGWLSATGVYVPPMMMFLSGRMKPELLDGSPPGCIDHANKSGWITAELFECRFNHFIEAVQLSHRTEKVLLILDGHSSHTKNIKVIYKAKGINIVVKSLLSHCTHRFQSIDMSMFKCVNANYNRKIPIWLRQHPGRSFVEF